MNAGSPPGCLGALRGAGWVPAAHGGAAFTGSVSWGQGHQEPGHRESGAGARGLGKGRLCNLLCHDRSTSAYQARRV